MNKLLSFIAVCAGGVVICYGGPLGSSPAHGESPAVAINFDRQIRPLLADNCFACHGPDEKQRKARLRLDVRDSALNGTVLVPGAAARSELYKRITTDD